MNNDIVSPEEFHHYDQYVMGHHPMVQDIIVGDGVEAVSGKRTTVHYRGWLTNGTVFDESYSRGSAFTFELGQYQVIAGWEEGVAGMKVGGKRRLVVPPHAGYGPRGTGPIPGNAVLVFDVELLAVDDSDQ